MKRLFLLLVLCLSNFGFCFDQQIGVIKIKGLNQYADSSKPKYVSVYLISAGRLMGDLGVTRVYKRLGTSDIVKTEANNPESFNAIIQSSEVSLENLSSFNKPNNLLVVVHDAKELYLTSKKGFSDVPIFNDQADQGPKDNGLELARKYYPLTSLSSLTVDVVLDFSSK